jgi:LppX_LprAFG lipoprotein
VDPDELVKPPARFGPDRLLSRSINEIEHLKGAVHSDRRLNKRVRWAAVAAGLALAFVPLACGGSSSPPKGNPETLLQQAKATLDAATSVHFKLSSSNVSSGGTNLTGGQGDLVRPDGMQGTFTVTIDGFSADVKVITKGGTFMAQLPFTSGYKVTKPSSFGLTNPAELMNPNTGLTNLLTEAQNPKFTGNVRIGGELLDIVAFTVPGSSIPVLPDSSPSKPVAAQAAINPSNHQLRQITLVGPFTSASSNSTFVLTLTNYNEPVTITLPAAS